MNCDPIAQVYRPVEYCAFGHALEKHRFHFLPQLTECRRALLLGDGDGRFAARLLATNQTVQVDSVDSSGKMILLANRRTGSDRIRFFHSAIEDFQPDPESYDLVVTNFFFDCFSTETARAIIARIQPSCQSKAVWIVSEFDQPPAGWRRLHARLWLNVMYRFFGLATGLTTRRLPQYRPALSEAGFALRARFTSRAGLICSECWELT